MERYLRNLGALSSEEDALLKKKRICVTGCGGLGGYVIELFGRLGVESITAVDRDVFEPSNLNRQILSMDSTLGKGKAYEAQKRMLDVNPNVEVVPVKREITAENCREIIRGHDIVMDCLDNMEGRLILEKACEEENLPMVHGAISGWFGQVCVILPGDRVLQKLYGERQTKMVNRNGNPSFTPCLAASLQVSEAVKLLTEKGEPIRNKLLLFNLLTLKFELLAL
ncbi:MAG: HesA/MoeB/ThiF family protein [Clostridia bacterium]|nr:HesA/MoeB/ThiF family protein [Clostridia bacterium]